eukprot:CAMPEP_0114372406 /NCGR_PEP_ID=MMETSP0101-20121206/34126_1 /TAXON_ID=38822 ORGANISM="Pteridomonas danica, Strain PT" /NCGR_SAMPLE_ID=MMETSP0101 /ASSEMBLY_ACC=CAM_ASM_000211 /LENGTH=87 /DNA_ID=CAMNT_0001525199 /DNA_START=275 /DNA_END=538 /DNA_ORIENTATION=-
MMMEGEMKKEEYSVHRGVSVLYNEEPRGSLPLIGGEGDKPWVTTISTARSSSSSKLTDETFLYGTFLSLDGEGVVFGVVFGSLEGLI